MMPWGLGTAATCGPECRCDADLRDGLAKPMEHRRMDFQANKAAKTQALRLGLASEQYFYCRENLLDPSSAGLPSQNKKPPI